LKLKASCNVKPRAKANANEFSHAVLLIEGFGEGVVLSTLPFVKDVRIEDDNVWSRKDGDR